MVNDKPFANISGHLYISSGLFELPEDIQARLDGNVPGGLIAVGREGTMNIYGGKASQTVRRACVENGGFMFVSGSLAGVYDCHVNEGGKLSVVSGAAAWEIEVEGELRLVSAAGNVGHVHVSAGGYVQVEGCWVDRVTMYNGGSLAVLSGAHVEVLHVAPGAVCHVTKGSVASAEIHSGGRLVVTNGAATEISVDSGGILVRDGRCKIHYQSYSQVGGAQFEEYNDAQED